MIANAPSGAERRRSPQRLPTGLPARCITLSGNYRVYLLDISPDGGRIEVDAEATRRPDPKPGETVILQWGGYEKLGGLVWLSQHIGGISFEETVTPRELMGTRAMQEEYLQLGGRQTEAARYANEWTSGNR